MLNAGLAAEFLSSPSFPFWLFSFDLLEVQEQLGLDLEQEPDLADLEQQLDSEQ